MSENECGAILGAGPEERTEVVCILPRGHDGEHGTPWQRTAAVMKTVESGCHCVTASFRYPLLPQCPRVETRVGTGRRVADYYRCTLAADHDLAGHPEHAMVLDEEYVPPGLEQPPFGWREELQAAAEARAAEKHGKPEHWQPPDEQIEALATVVMCHGGVMVVGQHELVYLAADGSGYAKRLRVMPFSDGTVSIEVDDG